VVIFVLSQNLFLIFSSSSNFFTDFFFIVQEPSLLINEVKLVTSKKQFLHLKCRNVYIYSDAVCILFCISSSEQVGMINLFLLQMQFLWFHFKTFNMSVTVIKLASRAVPFFELILCP
jgi:hypothetical protein